MHEIEQQRYEHKDYQGSYNNVLIGKFVYQENGAPPIHTQQPSADAWWSRYKATKFNDVDSFEVGYSRHTRLDGT